LIADKIPGVCFTERFSDRSNQTGGLVGIDRHQKDNNLINYLIEGLVVALDKITFVKIKH